MEAIGLFIPTVGDVVMNGGRYAVVTARRTLKSGKPSKVVTLMYSDGSSRTVPVRFCSLVAGHTNEIVQILSQLKESESKEDKK